MSQYPSNSFLSRDYPYSSSFLSSNSSFSKPSRRYSERYPHYSGHYTQPSPSSYSSRDFAPPSIDSYSHVVSPKEYLPSKKNWPLFQHFVQSHGSSYMITASNILYHIYLIRNPSEVLEKAWTMALRYWKEPFEVFERDMKWIFEGNISDTRVDIMGQVVPVARHGHEIAGELTPLENVKTFVDERLIYRNEHNHGVHFDYPSMNEKSSMSPIHGARTRTTSTIQEDKSYKDRRSSSPSSTSTDSWTNRNGTPKKNRNSRAESELSPPSKRSLFIDSIPSSNTNNGRNVVIQYETMSTQTDILHDSESKEKSSMIEELRSELQQKEDKIARLTKDIAKEKERVKSLEKELQSVESSNGQDNSSELKNLIRDLKSNVRRLEQEKDIIQDEYDSLKNEFSRLKSEVQTLKSKNKSLENELSSQRGAATEEFRQEKKDIQKQLAKLEEEKDSLEIENQRLQARVRTLQSSMEASLNSSKSELALLHTTNIPVSSSIPESILQNTETIYLPSLSIHFYVHSEKNSVQSFFKEVLQSLIDVSIISSAIKKLLLSRRFFTDTSLGEYFPLETPLILDGICTVLLHNGGDPFPTLWSIKSSTKLDILIKERKSPLEQTRPTFKSFIYQIACDLGKESFAEKWFQCLVQVFEINSLEDFLGFTQWQQLQNYISFKAIQLFQEKIYLLQLSKKLCPDITQLEACLQLYALKIRQFFHFASDQLQNTPLLDKDTINGAIRDLSKKHLCKNVLRDVHQTYLKVIASDNVKLLASHKFILFYGLKGASMRSLSQSLPSSVGFSALSELDLQNLDISLQRLRLESKNLQFLPCSLSVSNFHQLTKKEQLDILDCVEGLRNVFLFIATDEVRSIDSSILKRISFKFHFGAVNARDRWKFIRKISSASGIQIETSEQRNMFMAVTTNFTFEPLRNLVDWLPTLAIEKSITEWTPEIVVPSTESIAKQFGIHFGQYCIPTCFKIWSDLHLPLFVSPLQENINYQGTFLIHTGVSPVSARFKNLPLKTFTGEVRPSIDATSTFTKSSLLSEHVLLPQKVQNTPSMFQALSAVLLQFGIVDQLDYSVMIDVTSCIEACGTLKNVDKIIEYIEFSLSECQLYDRSILLFVLDGLTVPGDTIWEYIVHACSTRSIHNHAMTKKQQTQTKALWIGCITSSDTINLAIEKALHFPRNESTFNFEKLQLSQSIPRPSISESVITTGSTTSHGKEPHICKTCGLKFIPEEDELCCFHPGELVEIDRQTGEVNTTDKRTALLQEFVFKERSNILIWICCYNSINHEGCKKMKHSSSIDKKQMFLEEAQDNYEMIRVNPHLFKMRKEEES